MAAVTWTRKIVLFALVHFAYSFGLIDDILGGPRKCESICAEKYPIGLSQGQCTRGCRFFTIIGFISGDDNLNNTQNSCQFSCQQAHEDRQEEQACNLGCSSQVDIVADRRKAFLQHESLQPPSNDLLSPFLYVHNLYSNMIQKLSHQATVSWSFYMQNSNGQLVVVKSEPQIVRASDGLDKLLGDVEDDLIQDDYKTSNYVETNIASLDNSITPNVKHSQVHAQDMDNLNYMSKSKDDIPQDWLGCISKKTGIPRLLLSMTIFLSAMVMIWLCLTTAATAPEQKITRQKLSIYGDLDYLKQLNDKSLLANVHPQDEMQASPLPIKIKVERI